MLTAVFRKPLQGKLIENEIQQAVAKNELYIKGSIFCLRSAICDVLLDNGYEILLFPIKLTTTFTGLFNLQNCSAYSFVHK